MGKTRNNEKKMAKGWMCENWKGGNGKMGELMGMALKDERGGE